MDDNMEYLTELPCDDPREDPQDAADYPDEPRQCVCRWLIQTHHANERTPL